MADDLLGPDRVVLLLALIPFLREHGPTPVDDLARHFDVAPQTVRSLVEFLGTAGVPGETMTYQDEDLFDIDWDALEHDDVVSLTRTVAVDDAPRFAPAETAALIAGLQALTPVLPPKQVEKAQATAAKLAAALGDHGANATITVSADPVDERLPTLVETIEHSQAVAFRYRAVSGAESMRTVTPLTLQQVSGVWYLAGFCHDREAERTFRLDHLHELRVIGTDQAAEPSRTAPAHGDAPAEVLGNDDGFELIARVDAAALPAIAGFQPEILETDESAATVLVSIEAWHAGAALQLVRCAPGRVSVIAPDHARLVVHEWAEQALAGYDVE